MVVKLEIVLHPDGRVAIDGPLENRILCLGLLAEAEELVRQVGRQAEAARKVEVAPAGLVLNGRGKA
jgi:predicted component of type VI protein secretion system